MEIAQFIACEIHPLNKLRVLKYLTGEMGRSQAQKKAWYAHWIAEGLDAVRSINSNDRAR